MRSARTLAAIATLLLAATPNAPAAGRASVTGASARERAQARSALSLLGPDARRIRLRFTSGAGGRELLVTSPATSDAILAARQGLLMRLAAEETSSRLVAVGERVVWRIGADGARGVGERLPPLPEADMRRDAASISDRLAEAGWGGVPVRLYLAGRGGVFAVARLDDHALLAGENTSFRTTVLGPSGDPGIVHWRLELEGPGGVLVGGGGSETGWGYGGVLRPGGALPSAPLPAWLAAARIQLVVTISETRAPSPRTFRLDCDPLAAAGLTRVCAALVRERAVLFSPIQTDTTCAGGPSDSVSITGSFGDLPVERLYSTCYGAVTDAWEQLLQPRP